ncbi:VOC family protein [Saccharopolyspora sp. 6M]|uniref:VOC family protein n=1 Tax=Saccharopolyspora sp. 6M TaxID=2877237 RepID=UPI001CD1B5BB|nr:VOC family protein [Saccharopolyspora sp. 6M]MCA1225460.1 VOC family protein [Saccharopolyspora sp. 6M]
MSARCSHVLLRVDDLAAAVADFRAAGFQVDFATAEERALHAHVWFPDGPIVELLTTPRGARWLRLPLELFFGRGAGKRMVRWARQAEGFCDVAVLTPRDGFAGRLAALARAGVPSGRAVRWKRRRPDGARTEFSFAYPRNDRLPFLVTPYDPPQHPPAVAHPNGATALRTVEVGVRARDLPAFRALVGDAPGFRVREAPVTGVLAIEIAGLDHDVDPALTHGAVLRAAPADG